MKTTALFTAALLSLPLAVGPAGAETKKWTIAPGKVVRADPRLTRALNPQLTGTFRLVEAGAAGIESNQTGGACLIADLTGQGIGERSCRTDNDCNAATIEGEGAFTPGRKMLPAGYEGYCVTSLRAPRPSGGLPATEKKCWVRPGTHKDYCTSSKTLADGGAPVALQPGTYRLPLVPADPTGAGRPVSWRIHSCLNGIGGGPPCSDRASSNKEQNNGPVYTYRPGRR